MRNSEKLIGGIFGSILSSTAWLSDMENIVSMVCAILGILITIVTCIILPLWKKIREAKKDGIITPEEVEDITNTLKDGLDVIKPKGESKDDENK